VFIHNIPWNSDKNIGIAYNEMMERARSDEWILFTDYDAMFLCSNYGAQIQKVIDDNPEYGLFYSLTGKIGCTWQQARGIDWKIDDIVYYRELAKKQWDKYGSEVENVSEKNMGGSGFLILLKKDTWNKTGPFYDRGLLDVDWRYFSQAKKAGIKIGLMKGILLYHYYRGTSSNDVSHLK
jgi:GT2 family glycosyltransferase